MYFSHLGRLRWLRYSGGFVLPLLLPLLRPTTGLQSTCASDMLHAATQAVPFVIGVAWEARIRRKFLVSHGLALAQIGPFWRDVLQLTGGQLTPARSRSR